MQRNGRGWRAGALVMAIALGVAACGNDGDDGNGGNGGDGDTIVVGAEQFPATLNLLVDGGAWTAWATGPALARGYRILPDASYEPWLFDDDCTIDIEDPFTVSCRIREDAEWSDGTPVSADDFRFTYETVMDENHDVWSVFGHDNVEEFDVVGPKEFSMTFAGPHAAYRDLWAAGTAVLPEHVLADQDFNTVWDDCICDPESGDPIGSGPYLVESFDPDEQLTLVANDRYWDGEARTERVVFVPIPETDAQVNALSARDVDVIYPQESIDLRQRVESIDGAVFDADVGFSFERLGLLTTAPGLDDVEVRRAITTALPRQQVVDTVVAPVYEEASVLDNSIYVTNRDEYVPNWSLYPASGDVEAAGAILDAAGWTREGDGVRSRDDVELRFTLGTTAGDQGRELAQQIIQDQLGEIGIEIEIDNADVDTFWDRVEAFEYPMTIFALETTPDPSWTTDVYDSEAVLNDTLQESAEVDELLARAEGELDPAERAATINAADRVMAESVVSVIPLYQKPAVLAFLDRIAGPALNVTLEGFTWNIEDWERAG